MHPGLNPRLGEIARREHARRSVEITTESFGTSPWDGAGPRARALDIHRDAWLGLSLLACSIAHITIAATARRSKHCGGVAREYHEQTLTRLAGTADHRQLSWALYGNLTSISPGVAVDLPIGDTISSVNLFDVVEAYLLDHPRERDSVRFDVGAGSLLDWNSAAEWMADARRDGFDLVRYILYEQPSGDLIIDLAAIRASHSETDRPAV